MTNEHFIYEDGLELEYNDANLWIRVSNEEIDLYPYIEKINDEFSSLSDKTFPADGSSDREVLFQDEKMECLFHKQYSILSHYDGDPSYYLYHCYEFFDKATLSSFFVMFGFTFGEGSEIVFYIEIEKRIRYIDYNEMKITSSSKQPTLIKFIVEKFGNDFSLYPEALDYYENGVRSRGGDFALILPLSDRSFYYYNGIKYPDLFTLFLDYNEPKPYKYPCKDGWRIDEEGTIYNINQ